MNVLGFILSTIGRVYVIIPRKIWILYNFHIFTSILELQLELSWFAIPNWMIVHALIQQSTLSATKLESPTKGPQTLSSSSCWRCIFLHGNGTKNPSHTIPWRTHEKCAYSTSDRGDFWAGSVENLVFPRPTSYMLTSFGFSVLIWGIFHKFF